MKFLARIRTDLQRSLAEQQLAAVLSVLRARLGELTLDDVHELIASPLGKGLGAVRVLDLLDGARPATVAPKSPAPSKPRATKPKKARKRRKAARKNASATTLAQRVLEVLGAAEAPLWRGAIAERIGVNPLSLKHALQLLVYDGSITAEGPANRRVYSLPDSRATDGAEVGTRDPAAVSEKSPSRKRPKQRRRVAKKPQKTTKSARTTRSRSGGKTKPTRSPPGMSPEKSAELARYGAAVLAAVKAAGTWTRSADLRARTGGTPAQFQRAVQKLEASGDLVRRGAKSLTEFAPASPRPGT